MQEHETTASEELIMLLRLWQQQPPNSVLDALQEPARTGQATLLRCLGNDVCQTLPLDMSYVARAVKAALRRAEEAGAELEEQMLALHTWLLLQGAAAAAAEERPWRYRTWLYSCNTPTIDQVATLAARHAAAGAAMSAVHQQPRQQDAQADDEQGLQETAGFALSDSNARQPQCAALPLAQLRQLCLRQQHIRAALSAARRLQLHAQEDDVQVPQHHHHHQQQQQQEQLQQQQECQQDYQQQQQQQDYQQQQQLCGLLTLHSSDDLFEGGTGCHSWDASYLLAEWLLNFPDTVAGKRVLELGCGPGLLASVLCRLSPAFVLATDGDARTLTNCVANCVINGHATEASLVGGWQDAVTLLHASSVGGHCDSCSGAPVPKPGVRLFACELNWEEDVRDLADTVDVVLASDVLYDPLAVPYVAQLLAQLLRPSPEKQHGCCTKKFALLATTLRQHSTHELWLQSARSAGLQLQEMPLGPEGWHVLFAETPQLAPPRQGRYVLHRVTANASSPVSQPAPPT